MNLKENINVKTHVSYQKTWVKSPSDIILSKPNFKVRKSVALFIFKLTTELAAHCHESKLLL